MYEKTYLNTSTDFWPLVEQGLVLPVERIEKTLQSDEYEFLHDRIHQGAYSLIPDDEKKEIHLKIARVILENTEQYPLTFMIDAFEKEMIESEKNEIMTYCLFKIQLYYLFGDYKNALNISEKACEDIPKGIIRYAARTFEIVILNDDEPTGIFSRDSYIIQSRLGSIVCLPLLIQDIFVGVIYLENNMTTEVFTSESVEILKVLSKQMVYVKKLQRFIEKDKDKNEDKISISLSEPLVERELEVLHLISSGMSNKEIAASLEVTVSTVKTHTVNIYGKLLLGRIGTRFLVIVLIASSKILLLIFVSSVSKHLIRI